MVSTPLAPVSGRSVSVVLPWPARSLPGVCARTGAPTRTGVVLHPRNAYLGAEIVVPFSAAAQLRRQALRRLCVLGVVAAVGFGVGAVWMPFLIGPAVVGLVVGGYAGVSARLLGVYPFLRGAEVVLPRVHPAFAAAVLAQPEKCGGSAGCDACTSGCLPTASEWDGTLTP